MLRVRPGATIHCGTRNGIGRTEVLNALVGSTIRDVMEEQPVHPGDAFLLPAGTMHYTRGGVLFYEIMQNSDVIMMLRSREHAPGTESRARWAEMTLGGVRLTLGADCRIRPVSIASGTNLVSFIFACRSFALERLDLASPYDIDCAGDKFSVLTQIEGESVVSCRGGQEQLGPGHSCLLPANLRDVRIAPRGRGSLLRGYVPDLLLDVVQPLRAAGIPDRAIVGLGGPAAANPLIELVGRGK
jgi:mannose-6-phosphate isomerase